MNKSKSEEKFSLREVIAVVVSVEILIRIVGYWLAQSRAMAELLDMAYGYSAVQVIGRFLIIALGVGLLITGVVFAQKRINWPRERGVAS